MKQRKIVDYSSIANPSISNTDRVEPDRKVPFVRVRPWDSFPRIMRVLGAAFEENGDIIQVKGLLFRVYALRDPTLIEALLKHQDAGASKCPFATPGVKAFIPRNTVNLEGLSANTQRKHVQPLFRSPYLDRFLDCTLEHTEELLEKLHTSDPEGSVVDIYRELHRATTKLGFDMFCSYRPCERELNLLLDRFYFIESQLTRRFPPLLPFGKDRLFRKVLRSLRDPTRILINDRRESKTVEADMIGYLLMENAALDKPLDDSSIIDEVLGHTVSIRHVTPPLALGLALLALNTEKQLSLRKSIRSAFRRGRLQLRKLLSNEYLDMTVSEILRHYPSAWILPRYVRSRLELGRYTIPAHSIVVPSIYHTHNHPQYWADPGNFEPERFSSERAGDIHPYAHLAFGKGARSCMGAGLAEKILKIMLALIIRNFQVELAAPFELDPIIRYGAGFHPTTPTLLRFIPERTGGDSDSDNSEETPPYEH